MFKTTALLKKLLLVATIAALALFALPAVSATAAGTPDDTTPPTAGSVPEARLALAWARVQRAYQFQGERLARAGDFVVRVQRLIDEASQRGLDTSAVQAALDAFSAALPSARSAHAPGAAIISGHAGFDGNGQVVDRSAAAGTVRALGQVIANTHAAMDGTGQALIQAIRAFRQAHLPTEVPTP